MNDIRMKEKRIKDIKKLNKAKAWTERVKDPIVYASKKNKEKINNENNPEEYSEERIKYTTNRIKDELSYSAKKKINKTINNKIIKDSEKKQVPIDNLKEHKEIEDTIKKEKTILERGKELAKKGSQKVKNGAKKVGNAGVSAIKGIMKGLKALITSLSGAGVFVLVVILMFSLVMGILFSVFGIFFSSENIENSIKMSDCIEELNDEMDNKINLLKRQQIYDEVVINSNKTSWKDVLSIYAVKVSGGDEEQDVITMDKEKKKILKEVFWDMNNITHNTSIEEYETDSLGTLEDVDFTDVHNKPLNTIQNNNKKTILHININSNNTDEMIKKYNFNEEQIKEFNELTSEKYDNMWYGVIYGSFHDNGEIVNWKQGNKEWANIKIGTTNKTIGGIGCLTTSLVFVISIVFFGTSIFLAKVCGNSSSSSSSETSSKKTFLSLSINFILTPSYSIVSSTLITSLSLPISIFSLYVPYSLSYFKKLSFSIFESNILNLSSCVIFLFLSVYPLITLSLYFIDDKIEHIFISALLNSSFGINDSTLA